MKSCDTLFHRWDNISSCLLIKIRKVEVYGHMSLKPMLITQSVITAIEKNAGNEMFVVKRSGIFGPP